MVLSAVQPITTNVREMKNARRLPLRQITSSKGELTPRGCTRIAVVGSSHFAPRDLHDAARPTLAAFPRPPGATSARDHSRNGWFIVIHAASFCSKVVRSDSSWSRVRPYEAVGIALLQICAVGSKTVHRASEGTGLCSGKVESCLTKLHGSRVGSSPQARP